MLNKMKTSVLIAVLLSLSLHTEAQNENISELRLQLNNSKNTTGTFDIKRRMCVYYHQNGMVDSLGSVSKQAFEIAQSQKNDSLLIISYSLISMYLDDVGDYATCLGYNFKALKLAEKLGLLERIGIAQNNIGWTYIQLTDYSNALRYCRKATENLSIIGEKLAYKIAMPLAYDNLAQAYLGLHQADSALHYTQLANAANLKLQNHYTQAYIFTDFARVYQMLKDKHMAEMYYKTTIAFADSLHVLQPLSLALIYYSNFLFDQNRLSEAKKHARLGVNIANQGGYKNQLLGNAEILRKIFESENNADSAYYYAKVVINNRDTLFDNQKSIQVQNLTFSQKIHEIETQQQIEAEKEERIHNLQYAGIAAGLLSIIILFLLISHSIVVNGSTINFLSIIVLLIVFEFINLFIHPFLSKLTHHSPLWMLLAMVGIAALLVPAHHKLQKWITQQLVEKNKRIRLAAAKKTIQQLEG